MMEQKMDHIDIKYVEDFDQLIKLTIETGNKLQLQPILAGDSYVYIEGLGQKIIQHVLSAKFIMDGYQLNIGDSVYEKTTDFGTVMVITRAVLEAYLTFHFLFVEPIDEHKRRFRFLCWHISGFLDRADHEPEFDEHIQLKMEEEKLLAGYRTELISNLYFLGITPEAQKKALNGEWKIFDSWTKLAVNAGFQETFFKQQYRILCSYSHSGRFSIMQIYQCKTSELQNHMVKASRSVLILILAKFIYDYIELWPILHETRNEKDYNIITFWKNIAETIARPSEENHS
jgi:hypothetical protein